MADLRIIIVGGVAGGASAATRARRMNERAEIILYEKDEHVSFANCGLPYHIGEEIADRESLLVATPQFLRTRFRLDVRVGEEVISIDRQQKSVSVRRSDSGQIYQQPYDKLILAPGASPFVPPLNEVDAANVLTLRNLADMDRIKSLVDAGDKQQAVVVGAGFIGLEMIEQLVRRGVTTSLIELQPQVLPILDAEMAQPLAETLRGNGVRLHLGHSLQKFQTDGGSATAVLLSDGTRIETDLVVLGIGVRPNVQLAVDAGLSLGKSGAIATNEFMQTSDPDIYAVGDAVEYLYGPTQSKMKVALAGPANRAGRLAGEHAATGNSAPMTSVMGTSIVRVFDKTAAVTGINERTARQFGLDAKSVTIIARHHAGYFPGAQLMTLKLVYQTDDGKILGAQIVGGDGVDKRIDVIATAMHFQGTVRDLAGLDLAYAPPFGAAKDPIHFAGFVACNELDGIESFIASGDSLAGLQVVDVRTTAEVKNTPLAGAQSPIHIPVDELRDRLSELDKTKATVVSCATGVRAHLASRILTQNGFQVANLSGGATVHNRACHKH